MHRQAARRDDCFAVVSAVLSSDPARSLSAGRDLGLAEARIYPDVMAMFAAESVRADGAEVAAIMTPNNSHFPFAKAALEHGLDVICDKPMTTTVGEAHALVRLVDDTGLVFCLTHNYTGFPVVRHARAMVTCQDKSDDHHDLHSRSRTRCEPRVGGQSKRIHYDSPELQILFTHTLLKRQGVVCEKTV